MQVIFVELISYLTVNISKSFSIDRGIMPGSLAHPTIVWVLPAPVAPYVKMHALLPFNATSIRGKHLLNMSSYFDLSVNA